MLGPYIISGLSLVKKNSISGLRGLYKPNQPRRAIKAHHSLSPTSGSNPWGTAAAVRAAGVRNGSPSTTGWRRC